MEEKLYNALLEIIQHPDKKQRLMDLITQKISEEMKKFLETLFLFERELFCEERKDVGNGFYERSLKMPFLEIENLRVPRTREKNFKPVFLQSLKNGLFSFEELILAMYQGGCSTRDISKTLRNLFETRYSPFSVSKIVSVVEEEIEKFKKRRIDAWYPVIYVDGIYLKIRRSAVSGEVVYVVMGISEEGYKEVLSFCVSGSEGESAEVWKEILRELKERGLEEPLLFVGDGLPGLKDAIKEVYPLADFQHCILHRLRASLRRVRKRDREAVVYDLRKVYRARSEEEFLRRFEGFKRRWMKVYPDVVRSWEERIEELISYLRYPEELRAMIYTTNVLERFFKEVKRRSKVIEVFPGQVSAEKVVYLVIEEMNERYRERRIKNFEEIIEELKALRRERYSKEEIRINTNLEQVYTQKT